MHRRIQLKKHLHRFASDEFGTLADLRESARTSPAGILIVGCADHGLAPDMLSFAEPGQCAVVQNLAASIPRPDQPYDSTVAGIEYAIVRQQVREVIVCSHLCCRVVRYWMKNPILHGDCDPGCRFTANARRVVDHFYHYTTESERQTLMICEHTLFQIENLRSHPFVRNRLAAGQLRLHGWVVDDRSARVLAYAPLAHQFVTIEKIAPKKRIP
ncbi:Carbonic anhydrase [Stieleria maiorica]|uniref:carbonic anhydrase n=1 Tax=Stieleria maiorica TaxID=2795974 RepID=A0A5B9MQG9_9BACT|nr:carbonic anhydrase [Stieleria maiorica]QEG01228.1 Carbonic anhydrase [Stieleria maiorica]